MPPPSTPLSVRFPALYEPVVIVRRLARRLRWFADGGRYAQAYARAPLPHRVKKHTSRLIWPHADCPQWLQENKVTNLRVAIPCLDGILVRPGDHLSFCRAVGRPTWERGFVEGMELAQGRARPGLGGGICQLANMVHWLALHSPLVVVERSTHSVDPFPDHGRSIPFGSGASIFYNYVDLVLHNPTPNTFQFRFWLSSRDLIGELRAAERIEHTYSVFEREHRFVRAGGDVFRENALWRRVRLRTGGAFVREEFIKRNRARVLYAVARPRSSSGRDPAAPNEGRSRLPREPGARSRCAPG